MSKFKLGDRVVRVGSTINDYIRQGDTGTVTFVGHEMNLQVKIDRNGHQGTNLWESKWRLLTKGGEVNKPYQRKTYRLLKDSPTMKKGALLQEKCDDGTQPYVLLNAETHSLDPSFTISIAKRSIVEEQPKFFEEVFQVQPQYMTQPELDQWEAFKSRKKPGRKAKLTVLHNNPEDTIKKSAWTPARRKAHSAKLKAYHAAKKAA